jgi:hypothetical protein
MENSIERFIDDSDYYDSDYTANYRFRDKDDEDEIPKIPFLKRLYSTNQGRSFDKVEYNLDMAIAKERIEEAIKDTIYSLPQKPQENETNKLNTSEVDTSWITTITPRALVIT